MNHKDFRPLDEYGDNKIDTYSNVIAWVLCITTVLYFGGHFVYWLITNA
mgnify:FL=1